MLRNFFICAFMLLVLGGCSDGSSSSSSSGSEDGLTEAAAIEEGNSDVTQDSGDTSESPLLTGVFVDSAVQGLIYQTESQTGTTNLAGEFSYLANETVEFFVGDISIGMGAAGEVLSPADLVAEGEDFDLNHQRNLIRFLQTLDVDSDPFNGIEIRSDIEDFTNAIVLDFDLPMDQFEQLADLTLLLGNATNGSALISDLVANTHFLGTLDALGIELEAQQTTELDLVFNLDAQETPPYTVTEQLVSGGSDINTPYLGLASNGSNNGYTGQTISITDPEGIITDVRIAVGDSAEAIAALLSGVDGVSATSSNQVAVDFTDASNSFQLSLLGETFPVGSTAEDISMVINNETGASLAGVTASFVGDQLTVMADAGVGLDFSVMGGVEGEDSLLFTGRGGAQAVTASASSQLVSIGGMFEAILDNGYRLSVSPTSPSTESVGGTLFVDPVIPAVWVENAFDPDNEATYNHSTGVNIYDSLGNIHVLSIYFVAEQLVNHWTAYFLIDGENVGNPNAALPDPQNELPTLALFSFAFNQDGTLDWSESEIPFITHWIPKDSDGIYNGAISPSNFSVDITGTTQLGGGFWAGSTPLNPVVPEQIKTVHLDVNLDSRVTPPVTSVTQVMFTGSDINLPVNNTTSGVVGNGYSAQTFTITDGVGGTFDIPVSAADTVVGMGIALSAVEGVSVTVSNQVEIEFSEVINTFTLNVNGRTFPSGATGGEIAAEINTETNASLPGISASSLSDTQLTIYGSDGGDFDISVTGGIVDSETILFTGNGGTITLVASVSSQSVTIGGEMVVNLAVGYFMATNPTAPSTESVAGTLVLDPIVHTTIVMNAFDPNLDATYNHKTSVDIADSLGELHALDLYFVKTDENIWVVYIKVDNENIGDPLLSLPSPYDVFPSVSMFTVVFNADGSLDEASSDLIAITNWTPKNTDGDYNGALGPQTVENGASFPLTDFSSSSNFVIELSNSTLLENDFSVNAQSLENYVRE